MDLEIFENSKFPAFHYGKIFALLSDFMRKRNYKLLKVERIWRTPHASLREVSSGNGGWKWMWEKEEINRGTKRKRDGERERERERG